MKCASCRTVVRIDAISFVNTTAGGGSTGSPAGLEEVAVVGDHSAKIAGCVRCLKTILANDSQDKIVVFSQWNDVLNLLSEACAENDISMVLARDSAKFQKALKQFKRDTGISVLLLPYSKGGQGLNIIEASHVVLIEPVLDPRLELQSIGRVHRIGQTKKTFVHKFVMQDSVEQAIVATTTTGRELTLGDLGRLVSSYDNSVQAAEKPETIIDRRGMTSQATAEVLVRWCGASIPDAWVREIDLDRHTLDTLLYAELFWSQRVMFRGRAVDRRAMLNTLTTAAAFNQSADLASWEKRPLLGMSVHIPIAQQLLAATLSPIEGPEPASTLLVDAAEASEILSRVKSMFT